jgi:hypothetical protein
MNRQQQANVRQFCQLEADIAGHEEDAEAGRWEQARLAFEAVDSGMTQRQYGEAVGKSQKHISYLCRVWKKFGSDRSRLLSGLAFTDAYRMASTATDDIGTSLAARRGEPPTPSVAASRLVDQMMADPKVTKEAMRQVMAQSSPTRRAVEHQVQASRHERKAKEAADKADLADRSAAPFLMFLAEMSVKMREWAGELQAGQQDVRDLVDHGYDLDDLGRAAEFLAAQAEAWVKIIHPELNHIPDNIIDIG